MIKRLKILFIEEEENMIWIKWGIQTVIVVLTIIIGMVYGWGLVPKRWSVVIVCYLLANALVPFLSFLNYQISKKMGWEYAIPPGKHLHKNPPKGIKRKKPVQQAAKEYYQKESEREQE